MGVQGLWQLLQASGQPVSLESLAGKVLGIDVSMWLHQASKGMRDRHGNPVSNAHLVLLFRRICKLLYYRIKPIFVFDGGVPVLKKQTLAVRQRLRAKAASGAESAAKKLVSRLLQKQVLNLALNSSAKETNEQKSGTSSRASASDTDIFILPPLPDHGSSASNTNIFVLPPLPDHHSSEISVEHDERYTWEKRMELRDQIFDQFQDIEKIDTESKDFAALPPEIKHEILIDLKDLNRRNYWSKTEEMPVDSDEFSKYQLNRLMKQSRLSQHINKVRKEMMTQSSGEIALDVVGNGMTGLNVETSRVLSEDSAHYFLIKGLSQLREVTRDDCQTQQSELSDVSEDRLDCSETWKILNRQETDCEVVMDTIQDEPSQDYASVLADGLCTMTDTGSINLSGEESETSDDDQGEKFLSIQRKRKLPIVRDDEKRARKDYLYEVTESSSASPEVEDNDCKGIQKESSSSPGEILLSLRTDNVEEKYEAKDNHEITEVVLVDESSTNVESTKELQITVLTSSKKEDITNVDEKNDSESSDDESFIEVPSIEAHDALVPEIFTSNDSYLLNEDNFGTSVSKTTSSDVENLEETKGPDLASDYGADTTANTFEGLSQDNILRMQESLEDEVQLLKKERGKQERLATSITDQMQADTQELLHLFGVPYIVSPMEAEAQCAYLDMTNQTQGSVTDDSDIWLFGGLRVYKNMFNHNRNVEFYTKAEIKSRFVMDREDLVKLALLCGSDYTEGLQGVGPVSAIEILAEFPGVGIEGLIKFRNWWQGAQNQIKIPQETKVKTKLRNLTLFEGFPNPAVFNAYISPAVDESQEPFSWSMPDLDLLRHFGTAKLGWNRTQVDELVLPVMKSLNQPQIPQCSITSFFQPEPSEAKRLKSSRVRNVINRIRSQNIVEQSDKQNLDQVKSSKGKATKGIAAKNWKGKTSKSGASRSSKPAVSEVNLSEESADESKDKEPDEDEFEIPDDVLAAIDLDAAVLKTDTASSIKDSETSKKHKVKSARKQRTKV